MLVDASLQLVDTSDDILDVLCETVIVLVTGNVHDQIIDASTSARVGEIAVCVVCESLALFEGLLITRCRHSQRPSKTS